MTLFSKICHISPEEFDSIHIITHSYLSKPLYTREDASEGLARVPGKRKLDTEEMKLMLLDIMGGGDEGGHGLEHVALKYGIYVGTTSNYFRHSMFAVYKALNVQQPSLVWWN